MKSKHVIPDNFKPVPGWPYYYADHRGSVWSYLDKYGTGNWRWHKLTRQWISRGNSCDWYVAPTLFLASGRKKGPRRLAHLVCLAWHGRPPTAKHIAGRINGNVNDCRPSNLRWIFEDSLGRRQVSRKKEREIIRQLQRKRPLSDYEVAEKCDVSRTTVRRLKKLI